MIVIYAPYEVFLLQKYGDIRRAPTILGLRRKFGEGMEVGMEIVHLPLGRLTGTERTALRTGLSRPASIPSLRVMERVGHAPVAYCAACARPIDFGEVWRGQLAYCSVECSLGGNQPA